MKSSILYRIRRKQRDKTPSFVDLLKELDMQCVDS